MQFAETQSHGEQRICAAARVHPSLIGVGGAANPTNFNYGEARRSMADMLLRPSWGSLAGALSKIVPVPSDAELWYDVRDVSFLQEDAKDDAEIQQTHAQTINTLILAGFKADAVVDAVTAFDLERLEKKHTGLVSVQMHKPGEKSDSEASVNGSGDPENVPEPQPSP